MIASMGSKRTGAVALLVFLFLYLPIITLIAFSFSAGDTAQGSLRQGLSLRWYSAFWEDATMQRVLRNSITVAAIATLTSTVLATMAALGLGQSRFRGRGKAEAAILLPLVIPEIVLGVALLVLFVLLQVPLGLTTIALAHTLLTLPVAYIPIRARLSDLDPLLFEAAADLYSSPARVFRTVTLPLILPGIAIGALLAFLGSFNDVVVAYFVSGPGATTLPVYTLSMVRVGVTPLINAVSTLLLIAPIAILGVLFLINRSIDRQKELA